MLRLLIVISCEYEGIAFILSECCSKYYQANWGFQNDCFYHMRINFPDAQQLSEQQRQLAIGVFGPLATRSLVQVPVQCCKVYLSRSKSHCFHFHISRAFCLLDLHKKASCILINTNTIIIANKSISNAIKSFNIGMT